MFGHTVQASPVEPHCPLPAAGLAALSVIHISQFVIQVCACQASSGQSTRWGSHSGHRQGQAAAVDMRIRACHTDLTHLV
ncbi:hypothetical protein Salmuc_01232 [Salipiger mucosus DSM 16094]|uniref:Uncharacterized protein n=1 Tax=Salipiger mucosus DSM 16094 TaxID=1123237 RepID=S9Q2H1_9RHOB|nr:hypothetical protein Salmuc_01232 [Salipiger mucosus DSM 16094]